MKLILMADDTYLSQDGCYRLVPIRKHYLGKAIRWELWAEDLIGKTHLIRPFGTMRAARSFLARNPGVK